MLIPEVLPDEIAPGYLGRLSAINGYRSSEEIVRALRRYFGEQDSGSPVAFLLARALQMPTEAFCRQHTMLDGGSSHGKHDCSNAVLETARFAEHALNARDFELDPAAMQGVILDALRLRGLTKRGDVINAKEFVAQFLTHHAELAGCNHFSACLNNKALSRLAKALSNSPTMIPPTLSVLIATWLFGSWEGFRARCEWRAALDSPTPLPPPKAPRPSLARNRQEHRQTCLTFMASAPAASRTDFWHAHPRACRWLTQYDGDWLESKLPIAKKYAPKQLTLF